MSNKQLGWLMMSPFILILVSYLGYLIYQGGYMTLIIIIGGIIVNVLTTIGMQYLLQNDKD